MRAALNDYRNRYSLRVYENRVRRESSVGIVTGYGLDDLGLGASFLKWETDFSLLSSVQPGSGAPTQPPI
jgi:hypothetical protein